MPCSHSLSEPDEDENSLMLQLSSPISDDAPVFIAVLPSGHPARTSSDRRSGASLGYVLDPATSPQLCAMLAKLGKPLSGANKQRFTKVMVRVEPADPGDRPEIDLSHRETAVLRSLVAGSSYKMIANELAISLETVRTHIKRIYVKLNVHNGAEAVAKAIRGGLI